MKYRILISAGLLSITFNQATAGSMGKVKDWTWVGTISADAVWARAGESQTFFLAPEIEKTYAPSKYTNVLAAGELIIRPNFSVFY